MGSAQLMWASHRGCMLRSGPSVLREYVEACLLEVLPLFFLHNRSPMPRWHSRPIRLIHHMRHRASIKRESKQSKFAIIKPGRIAVCLALRIVPASHEQCIVSMNVGEQTSVHPHVTLPHSQARTSMVTNARNELKCDLA